jgi:catechol 2,3-dioxygenase-like lactoylglutathione lyase family enzyme
MFETIDHIGLAVTDIAERLALYQTQFGIQEWEVVELPERHMRVAITTIGASMVELIAPTAPEAAFAKYFAETQACTISPIASPTSPLPSLPSKPKACVS